MAEKHHLLSYEDSFSEEPRINGNDNHISVYKNRMTTPSSDTDYDMQSALKLINEQSEMLKDMQCKLSKEKENNATLSEKMETLHSEVSKLNKNFNHEIKERNKEIERLRMTLEAHNESQAAIADELRFQIQSLRNKFDGKGPLENGDIRKSNKSPAGNAHLHKGESPRISRRKNSIESAYSTNSSPYLMSQPCVTHHGEITWRINAFTKKLKRITAGNYDDPSRSEAFTTGACGYRLSGWAYLNGRGKGQGQCLSVYIRVMAGEYDPILAWPIKPCYTFHLISQEEDANKRFDLVRVRDLSIKHSGIYRPLKDDKTIIVGFDDFVLHEDIEKKNYLLDDSLFLRIVVDIPAP